jgi:hypothetical protein
LPLSVYIRSERRVKPDNKRITAAFEILIFAVPSCLQILYYTSSAPGRARTCNPVIRSHILNKKTWCLAESFNCWRAVKLRVPLPEPAAAPAGLMIGRRRFEPGPRRVWQYRSQKKTGAISQRTDRVRRSESRMSAAHVYKSLWVVEDILRTTKSILETRPSR